MHDYQMVISEIYLLRLMTDVLSCDVTHVMLHDLGVEMSVGSSGRIVLEVEPDFKKSLYARLDKEGLTLKQWFTLSATQYLAEAGQFPLFAVNTAVLEKEV